MHLRERTVRRPQNQRKAEYRPVNLLVKAVNLCLHVRDSGLQFQDTAVDYRYILVSLCFGLDEFDDLKMGTLSMYTDTTIESVHLLVNYKSTPISLQVFNQHFQVRIRKADIRKYMGGELGAKGVEAVQRLRY